MPKEGEQRNDGGTGSLGEQPPHDVIGACGLFIVQCILYVSLLIVTVIQWL